MNAAKTDYPHPAWIWWLVAVLVLLAIAGLLGSHNAPWLALPASLLGLSCTLLTVYGRKKPSPPCD